MGRGTPIKKGRGRGMFARKPGKGITLEMYIRNTQVNKKKKEFGSTILFRNYDRVERRMK